MPAYAQDAASSRIKVTEDDIIVTARKREETSIAVPVVITAVGGAELRRRGISSLDSLTRIVPALQVGSGGGNVQGGVISLRGLSGADSNPFADQPVSFNIDGVQVARSNIRRMAEMDTAQIEVLKGPQALFFGKNSPGGIISIRSADPTDSLEASASLGYEFNAREVRGEGFVSGPLTDTLGARLAFFGSNMRGWETNDIPFDPVYGPKDRHTPQTRQFAVRGTLKWEPSDRFDSRLKISYGKLRDAGLVSAQERLDCPSGTPQLGGGPDNCRLDGHTARWDLGPVLGTLDPDYGDGVPFVRQQQLLISNEMNFKISDTLTLTSVTGFYRLKSSFIDNFNIAFDKTRVLANAGQFGVREISQEARLASSFDGPFNFMMGGIYNDSRALVTSHAFVNIVTPTSIVNYLYRQRGEAYSGFAQVMVKPIDVVEVSLGGRYSHESKRLTDVRSSPSSTGRPTPVPVNPLVPRKDSWNNFSPEVTVSYRPTSDLTLFGSYKRGFLSGGFNAGAPGSPTARLDFDQQKIKGFEGGVKAALLDRALRTNFAVYSYKVTGLQVTQSTTINNVPVQIVTNAGKVSIKGAEFDANYRTPFGIILRGAVAYNDAKYDNFTVGCYRGQTQALGCRAGLPAANGSFSAQDLSGGRVLRAPKWTASGGAGYESDVGADLRLGLNVDASFSSSYFADATNNPTSRQKKYGLIDANINLETRDERYQIALIGRNLTNKYYVQRTIDTTLDGTAGGGTTGRLADTQGAVNRGREIMLRLTVRFSK